MISKLKLNTFGEALYRIMILLAAVLFVAHNDMAAWNHIPLFGVPETYYHYSNFGFSVIVMMLATFFFSGGKSRAWAYTAGLAASVIAVNLIVELWITAANTTDIVDAYYGVAGVIFSVIVLVIISQYGLKKRAVTKSA